MRFRPLARPGRRATVTVVVPCYQYGHYLGDSVGSALAQEGVDVDVIIVDDASPDDSADVARRLADDDPRVSVIVHEVNKRHIATYNDGLTQAKGDYVLLLSADDLLVPGALARAVGVMQANPGVGMVYGFAPDLVGESIPVRRDVQHSTVWRGEQWLRAVCRSGQNPVCTPTAVMRRDMLEATGGYDPALPHTADLLMWLRSAAYADVAYVNGVDQAHYRVHGSNMHTTSFGALVTDLRERRAAFVTLAGELGDADLGQELLASATRALVREAQAARRDLDPADSESAEAGRALDEFVAEHESTPGSLIDRALELPAVARRTVPAIGNRVDWRYWRRFGLRL